MTPCSLGIQVPESQGPRFGASFGDNSAAPSKARVMSKSRPIAHIITGKYTISTLQEFLHASRRLAPDRIEKCSLYGDCIASRKGLIVRQHEHQVLGRRSPESLSP